MEIKDLCILVVAIVLPVAFGWGVSVMCAHQTFANWTFLLSCISFAALGPFWALTSARYPMRARVVASVATPFVGIIGLIIAVGQIQACAQPQPSPPSINCNNQGPNYGTQSTHCGNTYNYGPRKRTISTSDFVTVRSYLASSNAAGTVNVSRVQSGCYDCASLAKQFIELLHASPAFKVTESVSGNATYNDVLLVVRDVKNLPECATAIRRAFKSINIHIDPFQLPTSDFDCDIKVGQPLS